MRIELELFDLQFQINHKPIADNCFIDISEEELYFKCMFTADEDKEIVEDIVTEWQRKNYSYETSYKRSTLNMVDKRYFNHDTEQYKSKHYVVYLSFFGVAEDLRIFCKTKTKADYIFNLFRKWMFTGMEGLNE